MNIFKSFEMFWSLPRKLFGNKFFTVQHVETAAQQEAADVSVDVSEKDVYLTVYNSPKVYSLLTSVLYKKKLLNENQDGKVYKKRSIS